MKDFTFKGGVTRYWWVPLLTGLLAIALGVWCLCAPAEMLPALAWAFAVVFCAAGVCNVIFSLVNTRYPGWGWSLAMGIIELICGVWMLSLPPLAMTTVFVYAVGIYILFAVTNGIAEACSVWRGAGAWVGWLVALLLITLVFAIIFLSGPIAGGIAVWLYIGISFIFYGVYRVSIALAIRKVNRKIRF